MTVTETLLIAFGVSIDAAAVSVSGSLCPGKYSKRHCALNAALFFGGFQFIMPLTGALTAKFLSGTVGHLEHYIAAALLAFVGSKMIADACRQTESGESCPIGEFFSPRNLLIPAIATSIDALAIGAGLYFSGENVFIAAIFMGIITAAVSIICVLSGKHIAAKSSWNVKKLTISGGVVIIAIGIKILLQYLQIIPAF